MSRLAKKPIALPAGVSATIEGSRVTIKGPKGELTWQAPEGISLDMVPGGLMVRRRGDDVGLRRLQGTTWSLLNGMVGGVHAGYQKELEIQGVGYKAAKQGRTLTLSLGFSHPVTFEVPDGIQIDVPDATTLRVSGCVKSQVGDVAARLRAFCRAEPYKGKGLRYKGEQVRRKAGKTVG